MDDKNRLIENYINNKVKEIKSLGINVDNSRVNTIINRYKNSSYSLDDIIEEIDDLVDEYLDNIRKMKEEKELIDMLDNKDLTDLDLEYTGITLNGQDVDLINIMRANSIEELQEIINNSFNLNIDLSKLDTINLETIKNYVFHSYQDFLVDKNTFFRDPDISKKKIIQFLRENPNFTDEDIDLLADINSSTSSNNELINTIIDTFGEEKSLSIFKAIHRCVPIEKSGIKKTYKGAIQSLLSKIEDNYGSITIDAEAKYGNVTIQDGSFDFSGLDKAITLAKDLDKKVRLNALVFYMDCPEELYNLDANDENKTLVKNKLITYVDSITKHISKEYDDTVRSIDVLNELFNRFPLNGETPYKYRGNIEQLRNERGKVNDNIKAGWLKFLSIEDLCDVIAVARNNLPNVDFTYNDDNMEDPRKVDSLNKLLETIHNYENTHNIKLIDSIGTQMHIDSNVSVEDIDSSFKKLSELGLPIEITEFDLVMNNLNGLTDKEIREKRQKRINEIYECIDRNKEKCDIRGLTIWSKTDSQNFRLSLENQKRIASGQEPITTLFGGYYTEGMESKSKAKEISFNYHTHTMRCGHANNFSDSEYIQSAKQAGLTTIGFSDHVPNTEFEYPDNKHRMDITDVDEYLTAIDSLRKENPDMTILSGFEAEYDPAKKEFLVGLRDKVDYLILGQHFLRDGINKLDDKNNPDYPLEYARQVCEAMDTGLFDMIAHPDIFMVQLNSIEKKEDKKKFMKNAKEASRLICWKAKEMDIPLEINLSGLYKGNEYPNSIFWDIASETDNKAIVGADAHNPIQLRTMIIDQERAIKTLENPSLIFVEDDYNPVKAREKNIKLQEALDTTKKESIPYDEYIKVQLFNKLIDSIDKDISFEEKLDLVIAETEKIRDREDPERMIQKISNDENLDKSKKEMKLSQLKEKLSDPHYMDAYGKRKKKFNETIISIREAKESGCKSKEEVSKHISNKDNKKQINNPQNSIIFNNQSNNKQPEKKKAKVLTKNKKSNGYVGTITLTAIMGICICIILLLTIFLVLSKYK